MLRPLPVFSFVDSFAKAVIWAKLTVNYSMSENNITITNAPAGSNYNGPSNGIAVAGFVCALCSLFMFWLPGVNVALWILGVVFSGIGISKANKEGAQYKGLAIAGLVIALVPTALLLILVFFVLSAL